MKRLLLVLFVALCAQSAQAITVTGIRNNSQNYVTIFHGGQPDTLGQQDYGFSFFHGAGGFSIILAPGQFFATKEIYWRGQFGHININTGPFFYDATRDWRTNSMIEVTNIADQSQIQLQGSSRDAQGELHIQADLSLAFVEPAAGDELIARLNQIIQKGESLPTVMSLARSRVINQEMQNDREALSTMIAENYAQYVTEFGEAAMSQALISISQDDFGAAVQILRDARQQSQEEAPPAYEAIAGSSSSAPPSSSVTTTTTPAAPAYRPQVPRATRPRARRRQQRVAPTPSAPPAATTTTTTADEQADPSELSFAERMRRFQQ